jgi:hypothetical protein
MIDLDRHQYSQKTDNEKEYRHHKNVYTSCIYIDAADGIPHIVKYCMI